MFTQPEIVATSDLTNRAYIKVYINGERHRFYNGKLLNIHCNPNHCKTIKDRNRALKELCFTLRKKLEAGWRPEHYTVKKDTKTNVSIRHCLTMLLQTMQHQDLSALYKRDIATIAEKFLSYLHEHKLTDMPAGEITALHIDQFLRQFNRSATYYMNKRRTLSGIFSRLVQQEIISINPVLKTPRLKEKASLHKPYRKEQLHQVLSILEKEASNVYLCALLMYGCLLRPHQEIRNLQRNHFCPNLKTITLSGDANKSGRVRMVYVPDYVKEALIKYEVDKLEDNINIFTRSEAVFNLSYFNCMWSRIKVRLVKDGVIGPYHTLYSFRHTAAINLYMKTKDLYKLQQAMAHSSMTVTLTYLRSLGVVNTSSPDDVPEL